MSSIDHPGRAKLDCAFRIDTTKRHVSAPRFAR